MNELEKTDQIVGVGFETKLLLVGKVFHQEIKCLKTVSLVLVLMN